MTKVWESARLDLVFQALEPDKVVKRRYNDLVENTSPEKIQAFAEAINQLSQLNLLHVLEVTEHKY